ncbi:MAG: phosphatidate cytidylyltransferase [Solirubrobacteraceae bacterium]
MPSDFAQRVAVGVPVAALAVVLIVLGGTTFALTALFLGGAAMGELWGMYERVHPVKLAGFAALLAFVVSARFGGEHQVLLTSVAVLPVLFGVALAQPGGASTTARMALTVLGIYWIGFAVAHAVLLRELPHGRDVIIDVLVGTFIGDSGAYLGGRALGRRRLAARISPNKTVEGLAIGIVTAILSVEIAALYQTWLDFEHALYLGLAVAIAAPVGDLFESQVKRDAGTKDAGRLFGVHGGALDRLDAAFFALVAGYYVWGAML